MSIGFAYVRRVCAPIDASGMARQRMERRMGAKRMRGAAEFNAQAGPGNSSNRYESTTYGANDANRRSAFAPDFRWTGSCFLLQRASEAKAPVHFGDDNS